MPQFIEAVIFDMDGLMLDTERLGLASFQKVIAELGFDPLDDLYLQVIGRSWPAARQLFLDAMGEAFPFDAMVEQWRFYNDEHLTRVGPSHRPGLIALLDLVEKLDLPKAVATSTSRQKALRLLEKAELLHRFNAVAAGDEVRNGKPHPEIFLLAASRLGVQPGECLVFEDSSAGLRSAHAAGMIPILVPDLVSPSPEIAAMAHRVYESLDEALQLVREMTRPPSAP